MGIFNTQKDRYKNYEFKFSRPSMFGGFSFFPPVIKYLLISNIAIFIFQHFIFASFKAGGVPLSALFLKFFALNPIASEVFPFYPWQLFTYLFMHGNFWHLFLNMFALWMFGMELENIWGSKKFLMYYLLCGVAAGLANILIAPLFNALMLPTIGASGSVYGILVAFGMLFPNREIFLYFLFPIKAKYFVIIYMGIELLSVGSNTGVAHLAHLGGGIAGFIYILMSRSNLNDLFRFDKKPKVTTKRPTNIYRNTYYEKYNKPSDDISDADYYEGKSEDEVTQEKIDEILDKIGKDGYDSLTKEEKKILFEASRKIH
ncbi:MAG: rhomboid family intramembrane serine protease [Chlorobi bacterium]|nr:rhomboid family intramembrane serine protease [Chlorobiota bacterium]MCI0716467.1 rhomboid family intramembrane serine protease [Chlorobiota bacterium]